MDYQDLKKATLLFYGQTIKFRFNDSEIICKAIGADKFDRLSLYSDKTHSCYEFHFIYSGKGKIEVLDQNFNIKKGNFFIVAPNIRHNFSCSNYESMQVINIKFNIKTTTKNVLDLMFMATKTYNNIIQYDESKMTKILDLIFHEILDENDDWQKSIQSLFSLMVILIARHFPVQDFDANPTGNLLNSYRISVVKAYIENNIYRNITTEELAKSVFLCTRQLNRIVKNEEGKTPYQLISDIRAAKALSLIESTCLSLKAIAEKTGYSNEFHLSSTIKKKTGFSPTQHRKLKHINI